MKLFSIVALLFFTGCHPKCNGTLYTCPSSKYEPAYKTVVKIESCASSGRCRVIFDDGSSDLLFLPTIGMKVEKK